MRCPYCGFDDSKVTDSRNVDDGVRRRRQCLRCGLRFSTVERIQMATPLVIKKDERREEFSREKLARGVRKACEKRPLPTGAIDKLVDDIEAEVLRLGRAEVPSPVIGEMVMDRLRELDHIAYIRFASVYRSFADIGSLKQEVDTLLAGVGSLKQEVDTIAAGEKASQLPLIPEVETNTAAKKGKGKPR